MIFLSVNFLKIFLSMYATMNSFTFFFNEKNVTQKILLLFVWYYCDNVFCLPQPNIIVLLLEFVMEKTCTLVFSPCSKISCLNICDGNLASSSFCQIFAYYLNIFQSGEARKCAANLWKKYQKNWPNKLKILPGWTCLLKPIFWLIPSKIIGLGWWLEYIFSNQTQQKLLLCISLFD